MYQILAYVQYCTGLHGTIRHTVHIIIYKEPDGTIKKIELVKKTNTLIITLCAQFTKLAHTGPDRHPIILIPIDDTFCESIGYDQILFCQDKDKEKSILGWNLKKNIIYYNRQKFYKLQNHKELNYHIFIKPKFEFAQVCYIEQRNNSDNKLILPKSIMHLIGNYLYNL
jgi:hypothetical protein